jgi:universal stress protein A
MTGPILVAVSARTAENVFAHAAAASRERGASIMLLNVIDTASCFIGAADFDCGLVMEVMQAQSRQIVSAAERWFVSRRCAVDTHVLQLPAYGHTVGHAIAAFADAIEADVVLLGARQHDGWLWFRDDIAADVVRNTRAAVQRVPGPISADEMRGGARPCPAARATGRA